MQTASLSSGFFYNLFHALGLSASESSRLQSILARPGAIVVTVIVTVAVSRLGGRAIRRTLGHLRERAATSDPGRASRIETISRILANVWRLVVDTIGGIVILSIVGLDLTPFVAGATVIGATIGFGAQSLVRDFLSGMLMLLEDQYRIGDLVVINEVVGTVDEVSLRVTRLRDVDGTEWFVPNGQILKVGNRARHWSRAIVKAQIGVQVDIGEATKLLAETMLEAVRRPELQGKLLSTPRVLGVSQVTTGAITIDVEVRTQPLASLEVERALLEAATDALRRSGMLPPSEAA